MKDKTTNKIVIGIIVSVVLVVFVLPMIMEWLEGPHSAAAKEEQKLHDNDTYARMAEVVRVEEQYERVEQEAQNRNRLRKLEATVAEMKATGAIYSIENSRVRIPILVWLSMDVKQKEQVVTFFSEYFKLKTGHGNCVEILSDRNDTKLAEVNMWYTIKIYQ